MENPSSARCRNARSRFIEAKTVARGGKWLKARSSPVLRVPSILIPEESNYLLNPEHPRADEIGGSDARLSYLPSITYGINSVSE